MKKLLYYSALILFFMSPLYSNGQDFVRIENIEFQTKDLGEMTYDNAKIAINNLGEGWRLPNERELIMMFNYQNKIGGLSRREYKVVQDYWIYTGNYCGENSNGQLVILRTLVDPGLTLTYNKSDVDKRTFSFIRAVRNVPELKKVVSKNSTKVKSSGSSENQGCEIIILEYEKFAKEFIKYSNSAKSGNVKFNINEFVKWEREIRKQNSIVQECATGSNRFRVLKTMEKVLVAVQSTYGNSSSSSSSISSVSNNKGTNNSKQSKSHTYKVIISWDNPVSSYSYKKPSVQNGIIEYYYERGGSYTVKPICPICSKKQYSTISGTAQGKDSKIVTINCN